MISFDGLSNHYLNNKDSILSIVDQVLREGKRHRSRFVQELEVAISEDKNSFRIATSSGTAALEASLRAAKITYNDIVLVPAFSFVATASTILSVGAKPKFIDVSPDYPFIDLSKIKLNYTSKVKAIVVAHLYGITHSIDSIIPFCRKNNIAIIEDAAQAYGSYQISNNIMPNDIHIGILSFDPFKVLPGITGGGMVLTRNFGLAEKVRLTKCHGYCVDTDDFIFPGTNSDMSSLDAAVIHYELQEFSKNNEKRKKIAYSYNSAIQKNPHIRTLTDPTILPNNYHKFVIMLEQRIDFQKFMKNNNIITKIHYKALNELFIFHNFSRKKSYPNANKFSDTVISLPIHSSLSFIEIEKICSLLASWKM